MTTTYQATYAHQISDTPGVLTFTAESKDDAVQQANKFVTDGFRNGTWVSLDLGDSGYAARNVHGKAVGKLTEY